MIVIYYINYLNHHHISITDELHKQLGNNFICICTVDSSRAALKGGQDYSNRPYCINSAVNRENYLLAVDYARTADVCLFGADSLSFAVERARFNTTGLSFEIGERWFKKGLVNILSPRLIKNLWYYHTLFKHRNFYKLCASAYAAKDQERLLSYKNKCFKWGYFPKTTQYSARHYCSKTLRIMWCSRFLKWKHPELPIKAASVLSRKGYKFYLDMFGEGQELESCKELVTDLNLGGVVNFYGAMPNQQIVDEMTNHDIFLFTSDRHEGWGVVLNEAMASGCVVISSNLIGAAPYLIKDGENGLIFSSEDIDSLVDKIQYLLDHPNQLSHMGYMANKTICNTWSPEVAVSNFLKLITDLQNCMDTSIQEGPCSKA